MSAYQLIIAPAAKNDLKYIYQYGLRLWDKTRSDSYLISIKDKFWWLTEQPLMGIERSELLPDAGSLSIQSHTLFYRIASNRIEIIRILHSHQDPQRHLK